MKYIIALILLLFFFASKEKNVELKKDLENILDKQVVIPLTLNAKILGRDTSCNGLFSNDYKIFTYIDSTDCISCKLHLIEWQKLIDKTSSYTNLSFIFVLNLKDYAEYEWLQYIHHFNYPVFYDTKGELDRMNELFRKYPYRTFLLNKYNKIIGVGEPVNNDKIWTLYKQIMDNGLQ